MNPRPCSEDFGMEARIFVRINMVEQKQNKTHRYEAPVYRPRSGVRMHSIIEIARDTQVSLVKVYPRAGKSFSASILGLVERSTDNDNLEVVAVLIRNGNKKQSLAPRTSVRVDEITRKRLFLAKVDRINNSR